MTKRSIIMCACTVVLLVYLVFAMAASADTAAHMPLGKVHIGVKDSMHTGFITPADIERDFTAAVVPGMPRCSLSICRMEEALLASDKIERANVAVLSDGSLAVDIVPMVPVARVFDSHGAESYYINAHGKRISAEARYHVDVPVVCGSFNERHTPARLLPLLSYVASRPELDALVSTVVSTPSGDIIIVPAMRGHVINFGDTADMPGKFARLQRFYRSVSPVRGWNSYDTISVKWACQVVATRRAGHLSDVQLAVAEEEFIDADAETVQGFDPREADNGIVPDNAYQ